MKKRLILVCTIILVVILSSVTLLACGSNNPKQIDRFYNKMQEAESGTIDMTMDMGTYGSYTVQEKIDGNKTFTSAFMGNAPYFTETKDGYVYTYTKGGSLWYSDGGVPEELDNAGDDELADLFKGENYEYDKDNDCFKLKDSVVVDYEGMIISGATITIKDGKCTLKGACTMEGITVALTISIYDIGKTSVTIPAIV